MTLTDPIPIAAPARVPATSPSRGKQLQAERVDWRDDWVDWLTGTRAVHLGGHRFTLTQRSPSMAEFRRDGTLLGSVQRRWLGPGGFTFQVDWQARPSRTAAEAVAALLSAPGPGFAQSAVIGTLSVARRPLRALLNR